jgi:hypothetical protein
MTGVDGDLLGSGVPDCSNDNLAFAGGYGMLVEWHSPCQLPIIIVQRLIT